jgi:hypothetical protein
LIDIYLERGVRCKREKAMRKLATLFLPVAVYALMGLGTAAADNDSKKSQEKPDTIITCEGWAGAYVVINGTAPGSVNAETRSHCVSLSSECSPCIRALENQGCKVVDVVVSNGARPETGGPVAVNPEDPRATFLLSCEKP